VLIRPAVVRRLVLASSAPQGAAGMHGWAPEVIGAVGKPHTSPDEYIEVFFAPSPSSRKAGQESVRRQYARTENRDAATTWATRDAQYDAVCTWGIPEHGALQRVAAIGHPVFLANGDSDPMILPHSWPFPLRARRRLVERAADKVPSRSREGEKSGNSDSDSDHDRSFHRTQRDLRLLQPSDLHRADPTRPRQTKPECMACRRLGPSLRVSRRLRRGAPQERAVRSQQRPDTLRHSGRWLDSDARRKIIRVSPGSLGRRAAAKKPDVE
jgi:hypothetical protein